MVKAAPRVYNDSRVSPRCDRVRDHARTGPGSTVPIEVSIIAEEISSTLSSTLNDGLSMDRVRIGLIGAGNIARLHARAYNDAPNAELYAVCDVDEERMQQRRTEWGATTGYTDYRELLADPNVDAVEIITPHYLHAKMGVAALEAGKHVSMQKPMATTVAECDTLIAAAKSSDRCFRTFENFQYYPPIVRAKELLESGAVGEPLSIRMKVITGTKEGWEIPYERWSWRFDPAKGGGGRIMLDYGSHMFALAIFFMGEP